MLPGDDAYKNVRRHVTLLQETRPPWQHTACKFLKTAISYCVFRAQSGLVRLGLERRAWDKRITCHQHIARSLRDMTNLCLTVMPAAAKSRQIKSTEQYSAIAPLAPSFLFLRQRTAVRETAVFHAAAACTTASPAVCVD